ncbi:putative NFX1-type zinc finger-containing protein 1-like 2, partial [Homarus americanus]
GNNYLKRVWWWILMMCGAKRGYKNDHHIDENYDNKEFFGDFYEYSYHDSNGDDHSSFHADEGHHHAKDDHAKDDHSKGHHAKDDHYKGHHSKDDHYKSQHGHTAGGYGHGDGT